MIEIIAVAAGISLIVLIGIFAYYEETNSEKDDDGSNR